MLHKDYDRKVLLQKKKKNKTPVVSFKGLGAKTN
jgi:hypothetical protein